MRRFITGDVEDGSVLVGVNTEAVLDALLLGIVVLDAELCAVYANVLAQNMLALRVDKLRGQPLSWFLARPQQLLDAAHRVFESGEAVEFQLEVGHAAQPEPPRRSVTSRISAMREHVTGPHLLLQVSGRGCIKPWGSSGA